MTAAVESLTSKGSETISPSDVPKAAPETQKVLEMGRMRSDQLPPGPDRRRQELLVRPPLMRREIGDGHELRREMGKSSKDEFDALSHSISDQKHQELPVRLPLKRRDIGYNHVLMRRDRWKSSRDELNDLSGPRSDRIDTEHPVDRHQETGARPSIAIASVCVNVLHDYFGAQAGRYAKITMKNHRQYAARHGYEYLVKTSDASQHGSDGEAYARFQKAPWLLEVMDKNKYDWIFWTDCDALFMNFTTKLEDFIPKHGDMVVSGDSMYGFNAGQFLFRATSILVKKMIQSVNKGCVNDKPCQCSEKASKGGGEQVLWIYSIFGECPKSLQRIGKLPWEGPPVTLGMQGVCEDVLRHSHSPYKAVIACAEMATYTNEYAEARNIGKLFRVHFAGAQETKLKDIRDLDKRVVVFTNVNGVLE